MATIDKITLPSTGVTYDIKDNVSGYVTAQTAPVTSVNGMTGDVVVGGGGSYTATSPIDITSDVISHEDSGVTAGTYGGSDDGKGMEVWMPSITVDAKGHVTSASNTGGQYILADTHSGATATDPVLIQNKQFASTLKCYNPQVFSLTAGQTTESYTISYDPNAPYYANTFRVADVQAVDSSTHEPVIVDWSTNKNIGTNITVTVSIASAWTHTIDIYIILAYAYGM